MGRRNSSGKARSGRIAVNGSFRDQRITGQQRYATEIAERLLKNDDVIELRPSVRVGTSRVLSWMWAQMLPLRLRRGDVLLTLTARGPLWSRRQAVVIYDLFPLSHPEWYSRTFAVVHSMALRLRAKSARLIITDSGPVAEQIRRELRPRGPVVIAPCAPSSIFSRTESPSDGSVLSRYGVRSRGYLLTVASRDLRKNVERLAAAYAMLDDRTRSLYPLILVGGQSGHFRVSGSEEVEARRLGYVTDEELAALYRSAAAVAFPSLDEGFGLPAVEALVSGARVVVSDIPVMRWVCGPSATYVDPLDERDIADGLRAVLDSAPSSPIVWTSPFRWDESAQTIAASVYRVMEA